MNPLVSIAIVTYNQRSFLKECIESVLLQDYEPKEIIVADDGSTDGTREMLVEYQRKYKDLFILRLSTKNRGITENCNNAHFACSGKYIAWIGGDDLMLPGKIRTQVEFMEANPECVISYHQLEIFNSETGDLIDFFNNPRNIHEGSVENLIRHGTFNGACSSMVRAANCPARGFNPLIPVASDWLYWIECMINGGEIRYIGETLGKYRRHVNNVTNENNPSFVQNILDHLNSCSYIICNYPEHSKVAFKAYNRILRKNRQLLKLDYAILPHFLDLKSLFAYVIYKLTFHKRKV